MTSSLTNSDLRSALAEFQRGITELKDIVVKKLSDDKPDDPRLSFYDFLKVDVVQLTSISYDKFQQETFNLAMRLKHRDKQQQRYQHGIDTSMAQTAMYRQASTLHPDASPTTADATDIYTHATGTSTVAMITTFTAALSTDFNSDTWTSSTADPWPSSTAKHAATAPHASDVSATAADAAAAGNSTTSANIALSTVTAANTTAEAKQPTTYQYTSQIHLLTTNKSILS